MSLSNKPSFIVMLQADGSTNHEAQRAAITQTTTLHGLQLAAQLGDLALIKTLQNLSPIDKNNDNNETTPLHYAVANNHLEIVRYLIDNALGNATALDAKDRNLLYYIDGHLPMMQYLIEEARLDCTGVDADGSSILHHCVDYGYVSLARYLIDVQHVDHNKCAGGGWRPLHIAARTGCLPLLEYFITKGCDVNTPTDKGRTALMLAAWCGHTEALRYLIAHGAQFTNIVDILGFTPMRMAVSNGHVEVVRVLLEHATLERDSIKGYTLLHVAAAQKNTELCHVLIENAKDSAWLDQQIHTNGTTCLHFACAQGSVETANLLLSHGAAINIRDERSRRTALHFAAAGGNPQIIQILLTHGAVDAPDGYHLSALATAVKHGHVDAARLLITTNVDNPSLLHLAVRSTSLEMVQYIMEHTNARKYINTAGKNGKTCLHTASINLCPDLVDYLIEHGAQLNATDEAGRTPLQDVAFVGDLPMLRQLIEHGANVHTFDRYHMSPLATAVEKGHTSIVRFLVEEMHMDTSAKAIDGRSLLLLAMQTRDTDMVEYICTTAQGKTNINDRIQRNGRGCLHHCAWNEDIRMTALLLTMGANVNMVDHQDRTPLHTAAFNGSLELLKLLLANGADPNAPNKFIMSPLSVAVENGHFHIVKHLFETQRVNTSIKTIEGKTLLHLAAQVDHVDMMRFLVQQANCERFLNDQLDNGKTCLYVAALNGFLSTVRYLLSIGAVVDVGDHYGRTALLGAAYQGHLETLKVLIENGADAKRMDAFHMSPLATAVRHGHEDIVNYLIKELGMPTDGKNIEDRNLLHLAVFNGSENIVEGLLGIAECSRNVDAKITDEDGGYTPLLIACRQDYEGIAEKLIRFGANVNCADADGNTPLHFAIRKNNVRMARLLHEFGADTGVRLGRAGSPEEYATRFGSWQMKEFIRSITPVVTSPSWRSSKRFL